MLDWSDLPLWVTILKRVVTLLIFALFGIHAYVQYRIRGYQKTPAPERWVFFAFSLILLFGIIVNFVAAVLAATHDIKQGPLNYGTFSLLMFLLYVVFAFGVAGHKRYF